MAKEPIFGVDPERLGAILSLGTEAHVPGQPRDKVTNEEKHTGVPGPTMAVDGLLELPGSQVGPYKLLEVLGEGGMGVVYLAEQASPIKRRVALKVVKPGMDTRQVVTRFEAERQVLAMLDHPNIAKIHDAGTTKAGRPYFVMEQVSGVPLTEHCDRNKLTLDERLRLFVLVCHAIQHAHQKGIIHRDIKPSNILVSVKDAQAVPKIIDFGVAKAMTQSMTERTLYTEQGQFLGTPEYMSPEQAELTSQDIDTRSDIYSLGAVLYELLTGALPFDSDTLREGGVEHIRQVIRDEDPKTPSTRVSNLGEQAACAAQHRCTEPGTLARRLRRELEWIPLKAMRKERDRRYRSASQLADDIENYMQGRPLIAGPESTVYRVHKFIRRNRALVGAAVAVTCVLLVGIVVSTVLAIGQARARSEAQAVSEFLRHSLIGSMDPHRVGRKDITVRSVLDKASQDLETKFKDKPIVEAQIRKTFGWAYRSHGEYGLAEGHFRRGLELYRIHVGPRDEVTLEMIRNVGWMCVFQGRFDEALQFFCQALDSMNQTLGPEHSTTLSTMNSLAHIYFLQGRFGEAVSLADQAMKSVWDCMDEQRLVGQITHVAWGYHMSGHYEQAEDLLIKGLDMCRRTLDPNDYRALNFKRFYGELCTTLGRYDQAEPLLLAALANRSKVWPQPSEILPNQAALAELYLAQGRYDEAEILFNETLASAREKLGHVNMCSLRCMAGLGALYVKQGRYDEAESLLNETHDIGTRVVGETHWGTLGVVNSLGELYMAQGQTDQARVLLTRAAETGRRVLGDNHPITLTSQYQLGVLYARQARYEDAEPLLLDAYHGRSQKLGSHHPDVLAAITQLVDLYESWGKQAQADAWRGDLVPHGDTP